MTRYTPVDSFEFKDDPEAVALLLPAVQSAREAARRTTCDDMPEDDALIDDLIAQSEDDAILVGLLLPAVQKAHEAAPELDPIDDFAARAGIEPTPFTLVELLVI